MGDVARMRDIRNAHKIWVGMSEGKRALGISGSIILKWEFGFGDVDFIHLTQDKYQWRALVNRVIKRRVS